jgi:hypothetical protein
LPSLCVVFYQKAFSIYFYLFFSYYSLSRFSSVPYFPLIKNKLIENEEGGGYHRFAASFPKFVEYTTLKHNDSYPCFIQNNYVNQYKLITGLNLKR